MFKHDTRAWEEESQRKAKKERFISWDYQMSFSLRVHDKLGVIPRVNQIKNIGVDDLSAHGGRTFDSVMIQRLCGEHSASMQHHYHFSSIIGANLWGPYGVIGAKLLSALFLAFAEIIHSRFKLLHLSIALFLKVFLPNAVSAITVSLILKTFITNQTSTFGLFLLFGFLTAIIICSILYIVNYLMFPEKIVQIVKRVKSSLTRRPYAS